MPVDSTHAEYTARLNQWERCRDAYNGADAVKDAGEKYLPQLPSHDNREYEAYKRRALWYGATFRTVSGLAGAVTRKDPKIDVPVAIEPHLKDITLTGTPMNVFVKDVISEILMTGRYGVLVDMADETSPEIKDTTRPYWVPFAAEQIINWQTTVLAGVQTLTMVVLCEHQYVQSNVDDPYMYEGVKRYRVLYLDPATGTYQVRILTPNKNVAGGYDVKELMPKMRGTPMKFIPFTFFGTNGLSVCPEKPPLLDLVDVNYSHYLSSADLEHGRHYTALPTPWVAGFPKETTLSIGSSIAWVATDPQAKAGILEFTGQGLGALENALTSKEKLMAVLGARMLEEQKSAVEAADTVMMRTAGERSALQSVALIVGLGLTQTLRAHASWMGNKEGDSINAELNSDFMARQLDSTQLTALVQAYQADTISYETFYWNLQRGEIARPDIEADEEKTLIDTQAEDRIIRGAKALGEDMDEDDVEIDPVTKLPMTKKQEPVGV